MIRLDHAARHLNDNPVADPSPIQAIYRRARTIRRRLLVERGVAGAVVAVAAVVVVVTMTHSSPGRIRVVTGPQPPPSVASARSVPVPTQLVAHLPDGTGHPGQIVVMDTATGLVAKVLGADYDPYVGDGFHIAAGGHGVFWTHLDEQAQRFPVTEAPFEAGAGRTVAARTVAEGSIDLPSPDGRFLLVQTTTGGPQTSFEVVDLASGTTRQLPLPALDGQSFGSASWLPDGHTVLALSVTPGRQCEGPLGSSCPTTTTTPSMAATRAWTIDVTTPSAQWVASASSGRWEGLELLGPGRLPGTVAAYPSLGTTPAALMTLRSDGTVVDRVRLTGEQVQILAVDHSGTNFLVDDSSGLARVSLANPAPVRIGPRVAEATWW